MKKSLILILIALLTAVSFLFVLKGSTVLGVEIPGIPQIRSKNNNVDKEIQKAAKLAGTDFDTTIKELKNDAKQLKTKKEEYTELSGMSQDGTTETSSQIEKYEVEALWVRLGNHATANGLTPKFDVVSSSGKAKDVYDLKITAIGSYISIMDFISAIENDSTLGFKIEEFKMRPAGKVEPIEKDKENTENKETESVGLLECTFTCKDILIKDVTVTEPSTKDDKKTTDKENKETKENVQNKENTQNKENVEKGNTSNSSSTANKENEED